MRVSVLVLNMDGREHLDECLGSLSATTFGDREDVLVDNGSKDGSVAFVRERFPAVRVVGFSENLGFAGAYDRVIRDHCESELVCLLNNDVRVDPGWLAPLVAALDADPGAAIAGARLLSYPDGARVDHDGGLISPIGAGVDIGKFHAPGPAGPPRASGFACGAALLVRRADYLALGGFDPAYVIYHEDVELAWKAWRAGRRVLHVPEAVVYHKGGALMGRPDSPRRLYLSQRNRLRNLLKHRGAPGLAAGLVLSLGFDAVRSARFALSADRERLAALWRANRDVLAEMGPLMRARRAARGAASDRDLGRQGVFASLRASVAAFGDQQRASRAR